MRDGAGIRPDRDPLVHRDAGQPDDVPLILDNQHAVSLGSGNASIDQNVFDLARPSESQRSHAISGLPRPNAEGTSECLRVGKQMQRAADRDHAADKLDVRTRQHACDEPAGRDVDVAGDCQIRLSQDETLRLAKRQLKSVGAPHHPEAAGKLPRWVRNV